jgi:hypothetical protein
MQIFSAHSRTTDAKQHQRHTTPLQLNQPPKNGDVRPTPLTTEGNAPMRNLKEEFNHPRRFDAYLNLAGSPLRDALAQMQQTLVRDDIETMTGITYVNNYPALTVSAFTADKNASAFVVFDSPYATYGVGVKSGYGLNGLQTATTPADAAALVITKLESQIKGW